MRCQLFISSRGMQNAQYGGTMTAIDECELTFALINLAFTLTKVHEDTDDVLHSAKE